MDDLNKLIISVSNLAQVIEEISKVMYKNKQIYEENQKDIYIYNKINKIIETQQFILKALSSLEQIDNIKETIN